MILFCDADGLAANVTRAAFVVLLLTRREIEAGLTGDAVDRLMTISDSAEFTRQLQGRLLIQVDGYDDDPRELYEIPEVVAFFRSITDAWPYWLHFLERGMAQSLTTVLCLLADVSVVASADGLTGSRLDAPAAFMSRVHGLLQAMTGLHRLHGIDPDTARVVSDEALAVILGMLSAEADS